MVSREEGIKVLPRLFLIDLNLARELMNWPRNIERR